MEADTMKTAAKDIADRAGSSARHYKDVVGQSAADFGAQAQDYASNASDKVSDLYGNAKTAFKQAADKFPDSAADAVDAGQRVYTTSSASVAKQVSKQPIEALLLAAAIGYLVGWATNRS